MPISDYLKGLRDRVGSALILVPSVTVVVRDPQERILLVRHADTKLWVIPGGSMRPHESPADAATREMFEETHLEVEPNRVLGVYGGSAFLVTYGNGDRISYAMTTFECTIISGTPRADGVSTLEVGWFSQEQIATLDLAIWAKVILRDAFRPPDRTYFMPPLGRRPS